MPNYTKSYIYSKLRKDFGKQPLFHQVPVQMLDSINPNKEEQKLYMLRNPVHREVQATMPQSEHEANTKPLVIHEQGINHTEGGWPRDVHLYNQEHLARHRRRVMHEDNYIHTVMNLTPVMEHYIDQNNAIDMYQTYFADIQPQTQVEKYNIGVNNVFRDPFERPISCIAWSNEDKTKLAVSYCDKIFAVMPKLNKSKPCYIWDIQNKSTPIQEIIPEHPCWQIACSPVNSEILIGGLENGTVNLFDTREGTKAVSTSSVYNSHYGPVTALLYTHSRTNTEFFTGSTDGQCLWWDSRNLSKPLDQLLMLIKSSCEKEKYLNSAEGVTSLEFDRGLPTKFLCGTESGLVISINRLGKTHSEKLLSHWNAHTGPVRSVHRSSCTLRMFITCGDWTVHVWSEEVHTAPIIVTKPYSHEVTDATWAPLRYSSYMVVSANGVFYYWDFLRTYRKPVATLKLSKHELLKVTPHESGEFIAVGDARGTMFLVQLSGNMIEPGPYDKQLMHQTYERETRREHILDTRLREIRLKLKEEEMAPTISTQDVIDEEELEKAAEVEYFKIVKEGLHYTEDVSRLSY